MRESLMSRLVDKTEFMPNGCIVYTGTPSQQYRRRWSAKAIAKAKELAS